MSFDFNLNNGQVTLEFDEPINRDDLDFTQLTLGNSSDGLTTITLTGGTKITIENDPTFVFRLSTADLETVKATTNIATVKGDTYLNFIELLVIDLSTNENPVNTTGVSAELLPVDLYTPDTTMPFLVSGSTQPPARIDRQSVASDGYVDAQNGRLYGGLCARR